jgi:hypothetical protein
MLGVPILNGLFYYKNSRFFARGRNKSYAEEGISALFCEIASICSFALKPNNFNLKIKASKRQQGP